MRAHSIRRPLLMLGAVAALLISSVAPAAAGGDIQKGQVGHYDVPENEVTPTVNCRYDGSTPKLDKFLLKPPSVWWPDTNSSNDTQHGKVGWQIRIQETANTDTGPWTVTYKSSVIKKTAYEDQPFLDPRTTPPSRRAASYGTAPARSPTGSSMSSSGTTATARSRARSSTSSPTTSSPATATVPTSEAARTSSSTDAHRCLAPPAADPGRRRLAAAPPEVVSGQHGHDLVGDRSTTPLLQPHRCPAPIQPRPTGPASCAPGRS